MAGVFYIRAIVQKAKMKRNSKIIFVAASVLCCSLAALLVVDGRNHCPLKAYLPKDAELVSCEYHGFTDFSTMIEAYGPLVIKEEFTESFLASSPELQHVTSGYAGWTEGSTWMEERNGPAPFDIYEGGTDQRLAIGYEAGLLTVIYERW